MPTATTTNQNNRKNTANRELCSVCALTARNRFAQIEWKYRLRATTKCPQPTDLPKWKFDISLTSSDADFCTQQMRYSTNVRRHGIFLFSRTIREKSKDHRFVRCCIIDRQWVLIRWVSERSQKNSTVKVMMYLVCVRPTHRHSAAQHTRKLYKYITIRVPFTSSSSSSSRRTLRSVFFWFDRFSSKNGSERTW